MVRQEPLLSQQKEDLRKATDQLETSGRSEIELNLDPIA